MPPKVFISHGRNNLAKHQLKDFIRERLGMEPVVLAEQPDRGLTIVEKLEFYGKGCSFALILLTADDKTDAGDFRARQNVIHELGYFHGLLGRNRVLLLKERGVELFSNISGLVYKEFPHGMIQTVFEDIRQAIESGDASQHATSVPRTGEKGEGLKVDDLMDKFHEATDNMAGHYKQQTAASLRNVPSSMPPRVRLNRMKLLLESEHQRWTGRIQETKEEIKKEGSEPSQILAKVMRIAHLAQLEEIQSAILDCLNILKSWQTAAGEDAKWVETAFGEIQNRLQSDEGEKRSRTNQST